MVDTSLDTPATGPKLSFEDWYEKYFFEKNLGMYGQSDVQKMYHDYLYDTDEVGAKTWSDLNSGAISATEAQGIFAGSGIELSPDQQTYLNNMLTTEASDKANKFTEHLRDTSLTSASSQLASLGLNPGSVISTGGAGIGSSSTANLDKSNNSREMQINKMNNEAAMTRTLLSMLGGLANAGIHGGSIALTKSAASRIASATAHSALSALYYR